jgi:hypothetical protein
MTNINDIRKVLNEAVEIKSSSTRLFREFNDGYQAKRISIQQNRDYTQQGKAKLLQSARKRELSTLMKRARASQQEFHAKLKQAKEEANAIVYAHAPKVDPVKQERFSKRLAEVKTQIALSDARKGQRLFKEFLTEIDEQAFAEQVKNDFSTLVQPILNDIEGADAEQVAKVRHELFDAFEDVRTKSRLPEAGDAQNVVEAADALLDGKFFESVVETKVGDLFGPTAKMFINEPDAYFELYPEEDKPESSMRTVEEILEEEDAKY